MRRCGRCQAEFEAKGAGVCPNCQTPFEVVIPGEGNAPASAERPSKKSRLPWSIVPALILASIVSAIFGLPGPFSPRHPTKEEFKKWADCKNALVIEWMMQPATAERYDLQKLALLEAGKPTLGIDYDEFANLAPEKIPAYIRDRLLAAEIAGVPYSELLEIGRQVKRRCGRMQIRWE